MVCTGWDVHASQIVIVVPFSVKDHPVELGPLVL